MFLFSRDRRGLVSSGPAGGGRSTGHSYGHVYGGAYGEDDYSLTQHQARTANGAISRASATSAPSAGSTSVVAPAERQSTPSQQQNGKSSGATGRYQDPAPRAWGDAPRYVASPTHSIPPAVSFPFSSFRFLLLLLRHLTIFFFLVFISCCPGRSTVRTDSFGLRTTSSVLLPGTCVSCTTITSFSSSSLTI